MTQSFVIEVNSLQPLPALTSIFTPPSSCRTQWTYEANLYNSVSGGILLQNAVAGRFDTACFPSDFANSGRASSAGIYSPGYCPAGYSTPAQFLNGATTTLICCLSSFSYYSTLTTIDNISPISSLIFAGCISTYPEASGATTVPARSSDIDLSTTVVTGPITMWGQPIQVAFQQKDLSLYTTSTSTSAPSSQAQASSPLATQAATTVVSPYPSTNSVSVPKSSGGLSAGVKIGIGLGAAVIGAFLIGCTLSLLWKKRQRARSEEQREMGILDESHAPTESHEDKGQYRDEAIDNSQPVELENAVPERTVQELHSNARVEMHEPQEAHVAELMGSREGLPPKPPPKET